MLVARLLGVCLVLACVQAPGVLAACGPLDVVCVTPSDDGYVRVETHGAPAEELNQEKGVRCLPTEHWLYDVLVVCEIESDGEGIATAGIGVIDGPTTGTCVVAGLWPLTGPCVGVFTNGAGQSQSTACADVQAWIYPLPSDVLVVSLCEETCKDGSDAVGKLVLTVLGEPVPVACA